MQVFIAGATGVLGQRLVEACTNRGHEAIGLSRGAAGDRRIELAGGHPRRGDVLDPDSLREAALGADVIINAATAIPTTARPKRAAWQLNDRVRREGTRNLTDVAAAVDASQFLQQSIVWVARQPDGSFYDETAPPHPDRTTASALDAEDIVTAAGTTNEFDTTILRCGWFYSAGSTQTQTIAQRVLSRRMPIIGRGDALLSHLHVEDAARAFVDAMEAGAVGRYHVVDETPVSLAEYLHTFAEALDAPEPRHIPPFLGRLVAGSGLVRFLTRPMPTSAAHFRDATGWTPHYPTIHDGIPAVCDEWRAEGIIVTRNSGSQWVPA
ncbi:NAD-dependent epimerase/dehydratase family protein [Haladaptatus sp. ZSTT2]|uniref:NAD-dependent epimerase/dehydratase family protein n=1 Tax=Haladaptatus sp. ZSTT2 TaxID=3120515 RepID=UPI00300ED283